MPSRRLHSRRSSATAAILFLGFFGILAAHLDANSVRPGSPASRPHPVSASSRAGRVRYLAVRRGVGFGVPRNAYGSAVAAMRAMEVRAQTVRRVPSAITPQWTFLGPQPITNETPTFGGVPVGPTLSGASGRVTSIAVDPVTSGRLFVGTAGGGVWMSTNSGAGFTPIFDAEPTLAIGAIALDPATNPPTIYVGTGEANNSGNSYYGLGLFVSSDLGKSWAQNTANGQFLDMSFARIAIDTSKNPRRLFAAVSFGSSSNRAASSWVESNLFDNGLWRSTDGSATWSHVPFSAQNACPVFDGNCPAEDVAIDPIIPTNVYASIYQFGVFASTDSGDSWRALSFPGIANTAIGRASVAALNGAVYVTLGAKDGIEYLGVFKSSDSGNSWTREAAPNVDVGGVFLDGTGAGTFSAADFDQALAIDPSDASGATVIFGGVGTYRSTASGSSWGILLPGVHSDVHALAMDPFNPGNFFAGNDGGVYTYNLAAASWSSLNAGLPGAILQSVGPHPSNAFVMLAGAADNGTLIFDTQMAPPQPWNQATIAQSGFALFDRVDPTFAYLAANTTPAGVVTIGSSNDRASGWNFGQPSFAVTGALTAAHDHGAGYYPPLAGDPLIAQRVFFGAHSVYVSTDAMLSWAQQTTQDLTGGCLNGACAIQDLEFAPSAHNVAFALSTQTFETSTPTQFKIFQTSQADLQVDGMHPNGAAWSDVTINLPFKSNNTQATGIVVSPFNPAIAYLSVSGFTAATGIGHVFKTIDSGGHWFRADGNSQDLVPPPATAIPDVPVLRLLIDINDHSGQTLLAGADIGIFRSTDAGQNWAPFNLGVIPAVAVFDLEQNLNGVIFAGADGRGAYQLSGSTGPIPTPTSQSTNTSTTPTPTMTATATRTATIVPTPVPTIAPTTTPTVTATPTSTPTPLSTGLSLASVSKRFGNVIFGNVGAISRPQTITLINKSTNLVTLFGASFQGGSAADYRVIAPGTTCGSSLGARQKCNYAIVFQPGALGLDNALVMVHDNAANSPQIASLSGVGIAPAIVIAPKSLSLGKVAVGGSAQKSFSITNRNAAPLKIVSITSSSGDFKTSGCVGALGAGASCAVTVIFSPAAGPAKRSGAIAIIDNAAKSPQSVRVSGSTK